MHRMLGLAGCAAMALASAACSEGEAQIKHTVTGDAPVRVAGRLDCPEREGRLRLQSTAADGRACAYRDEDGAEVELRLASAETLPALETELKALIPAAASPPEPPAPPEPPESGNPAGAADTGDRTHVRLPGMRIDTEGDRASVHLPGMRVEANGDNADVRIGGEHGDGVSVRAHDGGAEVHISDEEKAGDVRSTFLLTSDAPGPSGWRVAGYQARGSKPGPMVLGVLRARGKSHGRLMNDVEDLLDRNVQD